MFLDHAQIYIKSGDGGAGAVSFRREKYIPNGGPDGGNGGKGGDVLFQATNNMHTLLDFSYRKKYVAQNGAAGGSKNCTGKSGESLVIRVPTGTVIKDRETNRILTDLNEDGKEYMALSGGRGGRGNRFYANPSRQAPNFSQAGAKGDELRVELELKLLADVGLVGYPNVGKSTLLATVSAAQPKIADYPFTTLTPNLGVVAIDDDTRFVMADIPGLIEGAHEGTGLGHRFLKHIERTRMIIHVIDISGYAEPEPKEAYYAIQRELAAYSEVLAKKPCMIAANKSDVLADAELIEYYVNELETVGLPVFVISAATGQGVDRLMREAAYLLKDIPKPKIVDQTEEEVLFTTSEDAGFTVEKDEDGYVVLGEKAELILQSTNLEDHESLRYFQRTIRRIGIIDALEDMGIQEGDTVRFIDFEFEYRR